MVNRKIIIIGGGPSGLFTAYLLLKSGEKNVICYEKENILGGDWSENFPEYVLAMTMRKMALEVPTGFGKSTFAQLAF